MTYVSVFPARTGSGLSDFVTATSGAAPGGRVGVGVFVGVLVGVAGAALWREMRLPELVRRGIPGVVLALSLGYAVSVNLEMIDDSRYAAEQWFRNHVEPPSDVGAFVADRRYPLRAQYLPRVHEFGYATYPVEMKLESFDQTQPEYLILTSYNYEDFEEPAQACREDLVGERLGYEPIAVFRRRFLGFGGPWLGVAGWGVEQPGKISPTIIILRRSFP